MKDTNDFFLGCFPSLNNMFLVSVCVDVWGKFEFENEEINDILLFDVHVWWNFERIRYFSFIEFFLCFIFSFMDKYVEDEMNFSMWNFIRRCSNHVVIIHLHYAINKEKSNIHSCDVESSSFVLPRNPQNKLHLLLHISCGWNVFVLEIVMSSVRSPLKIPMHNDICHNNR